MYYSTYHYKITAINTNNKKNRTWIFLADGPGLGCDYLKSFAHYLDLPGNTLLADFPQDGTNNEGLLSISYWKKGLLDLIQTQHNPIIIAHGFSGMLVLDTPELESLLKGLVLLNVPLTNDFSPLIAQMQHQYQLPDLVPAAAHYHLHPSNKTYQAFWQAYKYYCFTPEELKKANALLATFSFNSKTYLYALRHFYGDYQCRWYPKLPTLTISTERNALTCANVYQKNSYYQNAFITNKSIANAGHFPWLVQGDIIKEYLMDFCVRL